MSATRIEFATPDANSADGVMVIDEYEDAKLVVDILAKNGYLINLRGFTRTKTPSGSCGLRRAHNNHIHEVPGALVGSVEQRRCPGHV